MKITYKTVAMLLGVTIVFHGFFINAVAKETPRAVLYSASDFQNPDSQEDGKIELEKITGKIHSDGYGKISEAIICGDYNANDDISAEVTSEGIKKIQEVLYAQWGLGYDEIYFVQGNHDPDSAENLDATGGTEREYYSVYQINHQDFRRRKTDYIDEEQLLIDATKNLKDWLSAKVSEQYTKPIFIITHLPLHNTYRYDNAYSEHLFDVINEAANKGLNIVYLFGHNHAKEYDNYLGGDAIFLEKGSLINIPDLRGSSEADYKTEILGFTYMNAGYLSRPAEDLLSSCIFEIYEDKIVVNRYTADGKCNLKNAGISSEKDEGWEADETVIESDQVIKLNDTILSVKVNENQISELILNINETVNLEMVSEKCKEADVTWTITDTETVKVKIDEKEPAKATVLAENYGITTLHVAVGELKLNIPILVMPETAKRISCNENMQVYKLVDDIKISLQDPQDYFKDYVILNQKTQGLAYAFAVQDSEMVTTEEMQVIYVPGIGEVVTPGKIKQVVWNFEELEDLSSSETKYCLKMSKNSPYRYKYYISPTREVDSALMEQNINKMRLYSDQRENTAAVFVVSSEAERGIELKTSEYCNGESVVQNENGTFTLCYDDTNGKFVLDNTSNGKEIYFYKKSDHIVTDVVFWTGAACGTAYVNSEKTEEIGGTICVMHNGISEEIPITLNMVTGYGNEPGTYTCNVMFNGEIISEQYELTIEENLTLWQKIVRIIARTFFSW